MKIYKCKKCNNFMIIASGEVIPNCCNEEMKELIAGSVEAAVEKHVQILSFEDNKYKITVGEVEHPMLDEHYIEWIALEFEDGTIKVFDLKPIQKPIVTYETTKKIKTVYAYCNLHGLWKNEL